MKTSRYLAIALCLALLCGICMPAAFAAGYNDTAGHWAESSIERWSGYNIVEGYDGSFSPDDSLTRGQMAKILSNTLGLTESAENPFADVPAGAWYTPYVLRCYAAGIMEGDGVNANPEAVVTRQETVVMFCRALDIAPADSADLSSYADGGSVADWAAPYMAAATRAGIVNGVGGNQIAPLGDMTRAAFMTVLDRAVTQYINAPGSYTLTDKAGLILVAAGDVTLTGTTSANILVTPAASGKSMGFEKANVTGSITVKADNAKITSTDSTLPEIVRNGAGITVEKSDTTKPSGGGSTGSSGSGSSGSSGGSGGGSSSGGGNNKPTNLTVAEEKTVNSGTYQDVTITEAVGDGTVTLSNMTIQGNLYINGGGSNTINLDKVTIKGKIIISKTGGEPPRLHLSNTPVKTVETTKPAIIEAGDAASVVTDLKAGADVTIQGEKTAVSNLTVPKSEGDAVVEIKVANATVSKVEAQGKTAITGETGKVEQVEAKAAVTVESAVVEKVVVPEEAENVVVDVRGEEAIEVEVNAGDATVAAEDESKVTVTGSTAETVKKHERKWDAGEVTTEPTCSKEGVRTCACTVEGCPTGTKTETIEK